MFVLIAKISPWTNTHTHSVCPAYRVERPEQTISVRRYKKCEQFCVLYRYEKYEKKLKTHFFRAFAFRRSAQPNVCSMISGGGAERKKCLNKHGRREKEPLLLASLPRNSLGLVPADANWGSFPPACMEITFHAPFDAFESFVLALLGRKKSFYGSTALIIPKVFTFQSLT